VRRDNAFSFCPTPCEDVNPFGRSVEDGNGKAVAFHIQYEIFTHDGKSDDTDRCFHTFLRAIVLRILLRLFNPESFKLFITSTYKTFIKTAAAIPPENDSDTRELCTGLTCSTISASFASGELS